MRILTTRVTLKAPNGIDGDDTDLEVVDEGGGAFLQLTQQGKTVIRLDPEELEALAAEGRRMAAALDGA